MFTFKKLDQYTIPTWHYLILKGKIQLVHHLLKLTKYIVHASNFWLGYGVVIHVHLYPPPPNIISKISSSTLMATIPQNEP